MIRQLIIMAETATCSTLDFVIVLLQRLVIGVGVAVSPIMEFFGEQTDKDEDGYVESYTAQALWLIGMIFVTKKYPTFKTITFGIGLTFFIPTITIGFEYANDK